mmetsp:Transcript_9017/g.22717  ORF Transcript_9017/g.22717 Transcript_9017/m.22717 type:complete len:827 (-) Transcript_9017:664-3144(-)
MAGGHCWCNNVNQLAVIDGPPTTLLRTIPPWLRHATPEETLDHAPSFWLATPCPMYRTCPLALIHLLSSDLYAVLPQHRRSRHEEGVILRLLVLFLESQCVTTNRQVKIALAQNRHPPASNGFVLVNVKGLAHHAEGDASPTSSHRILEGRVEVGAGVGHDVALEALLSIRGLRIRTYRALERQRVKHLAVDVAAEEALLQLGAHSARASDLALDLVFDVVCRGAGQAASATELVPRLLPQCNGHLLRFFLPGLLLLLQFALVAADGIRHGRGTQPQRRHGIHIVFSRTGFDSDGGDAVCHAGGKVFQATPFVVNLRQHTEPGALAQLLEAAEAANIGLTLELISAHLHQSDQLVVRFRQVFLSVVLLARWEAALVVPTVLLLLRARHPQEASPFLLHQHCELLVSRQWWPERAHKVLQLPRALVLGVLLHVVSVQLVDLADLRLLEARYAPQDLRRIDTLLPWNGLLETGPLLVRVQLEVLEGRVLNAEILIQGREVSILLDGAHSPLGHGTAHQLSEVVLPLAEEGVKDRLGLVMNLADPRDQVLHVAMEALLGLPTMRHDAYLGWLDLEARLPSILGQATELRLQLPRHDLDDPNPILFHHEATLTMSGFVLTDAESALLNGLHPHSIHEDSGAIRPLLRGEGLRQVVLMIELAVQLLLHELIVDHGGHRVEEPLVHLLELSHDLLLHSVGHRGQLTCGWRPELDHAVDLLGCLLSSPPTMATDIVLIGQNMLAVGPAVQLTGNPLSETHHEALRRRRRFFVVRLPALRLANEAVVWKALLPILEIFLKLLCLRCTTKVLQLLLELFKLRLLRWLIPEPSRDL